MAEFITVARPYAKAAFDEARKLGNLKAWSDMLQAGAEAVLNAEVRAVVTSPRVIRTQLEALMLSLSGAKANGPEANFIKLLVESQRLILLPEISALFEALRAEEEKSVEVMVTSAFDLNETQKKKITAALKKRLGREIRLSSQIDKALLGGVIIRAGDQVIDGSARNQLSELANALA